MRLQGGGQGSESADRSMAVLPACRVVASCIGSEAFQRAADDPNATLLARALREGTADLIAALATGRHINPLADRSPYDSILPVGCRGGGLFAVDLGTVQKDVSPDVSRGLPW